MEAGLESPIIQSLLSDFHGHLLVGTVRQCESNLFATMPSIWYSMPNYFA